MGQCSCPSRMARAMAVFRTRFHVAVPVLLVAIGSGGPYALSAARALYAHTQMDARSIATEALNIAGDICIYTNRNIVCEVL